MVNATKGEDEVVSDKLFPWKIIYSLCRHLPTLYIGSRCLRIQYPKLEKLAPFLTKELKTINKLTKQEGSWEENA